MKKIRYKVIKRLLLKRTRIFSKWLKINLEKPSTIFLACLFPFMQAFLGSAIVIFTDPRKNDTSDNISLYAIAAFYYLAFAMNSKRATKGSWLGLLMLVVFGALGIVCGKLFMIAVA